MSKPDHAGGPVDRIELLGAIIDDERVRLIHIKTARHILKRYYQKHGNARASVSFLQQATGLTRGSVASATEDLVAWGYFTRVMGSGKRPSEYHPNFSVLQSPDATSVLPSQDETKSSVLQPQDEIVLRSQDAKSVSVLQPQEQNRHPFARQDIGEFFMPPPLNPRLGTADIIAMTESQRANTDRPHGLPAARVVGCFLQETIVAKEGSKTRVIHRWPDKVGEIISD